MEWMRVFRVVSAFPSKQKSISASLKRTEGFTLLEIMLVLGVIGGIMTIAINYGTRQIAQQKRDKTAIQTQQILNAALAFYNSTGTWPGGTCSFDSSAMRAGTSATTGAALTTLTAAGYLPANMTSNPFAFPYTIGCDSVTGSVFYVISQMSSRANALVVAGELPVAYVSDAKGNASPPATGNYVTAAVTTPGQNLNNARSVNFAGVYHHGACVPVPSCPGYNPSINPPGCNTGTNCMTPQIMVAPASVSGLNDPSSTNAYPITSFTAYATSPATASNVMACNAIPPATNPVATPCSWGTNGLPNGTQASPTGLYWRVCLQVVTGKGVVSTTSAGGSPAWGSYVSMVVMTRCTPPSEPYGSDFTIFTQ